MDEAWDDWLGSAKKRDNEIGAPLVIDAEIAIAWSRPSSSHLCRTKPTISGMNGSFITILPNGNQPIGVLTS
jgi:hypothetical protein